MRSDANVDMKMPRHVPKQPQSARQSSMPITTTTTTSGKRKKACKSSFVKQTTILLMMKTGGDDHGCRLDGRDCRWIPAPSRSWRTGRSADRPTTSSKYPTSSVVSSCNGGRPEAESVTSAFCRKHSKMRDTLQRQRVEGREVQHEKCVNPDRRPQSAQHDTCLPREVPAMREGGELKVGRGATRSKSCVPQSDRARVSWRDSPRA